MAVRLSPRKGKVVHRQTFQNSNYITELTVKTYPKSAIPTLPAAKPFVRDCALQREIERIEKEKKNVKNAATKKAGQHKTDKKGSRGTVSIEVTKKSARKRRHPHIPDGGTWEDVLSQYSSSASHHSTSNGSQVLEDQICTPQQQPLPSPPLPQDHHVALRSTHHFTHSSVPQTHMHSPPHFSHPTSRMHPPPHPPSQRSTHPPPHSSHPPTHSYPPPHSSYAHTHMHPPQQSSRLPSLHPPTSAHPPHYSSHPPTDTHPAPHPQKLPSHPTPPSTQPQAIPSAPQQQQQRQGPLGINLTPLSSSTTEDVPVPQQPNPPHPPQPDPERAPEHTRFLSDNASSSPFGESALQILHRLRVQLQTRAGESECSNLVEALEAIISGKGSMGDVGSRNSQPLHNTPHYHTVFPTPEATHHEQGEQNLLLGQQRPVVGEDLLTATTTQDHVNNQPDEGRTSEVPTAHGSTEEQVSSGIVLAGGGQNSISPPYPNTPDSNTSGWGEAGTDKGRHTHNNAILLKEIERQRKVIMENQRVITSLKTLSSQLIIQQEEMNQKLPEKERGGSNTAPSGTSLPPQHSAREPDSGLGGERSAHSTTTEKSFTQAGGAESGGGGAGERGRENLEEGEHTPEDLWQEKEREYRVVILDLQTENEALHKEMGRLRELVENLELQLTRAQDQLSKNHCGNSSRSKVASSARPVRRKRLGDMSSRRATHSSTESNADSAYEERTGSRLTSKTSSPYSDRPHPTAATSVLPPIPPTTSVPHSIPANTSALHQLGGQNYDERSRATDLNSGEECSDARPSRWHQCATNLAPPPDHQPEKLVLTSCDQLAERAVNTHGSSQVTSDRNQRTALPVAADNLIRPFTMPELRPTARDLESWVGPEDLTTSSISTMSDHNFQDTKVSLESSFLKGIGAPRASSNAGVEKSTLSTAFTNRSHQGTSHLPLESTRVQDVSPLKSTSGVEGGTISVAVHTGHSSSSSSSSPTTTTTPLPTVDILD